MEITNYLPFAIQAAEDACKEILEVYHSDDFDVEVKGDHSPLTRADRKAHEAIVKVLQQTKLPILSEEGKSTPYEERKNWTLFWMVDPLDGTKEFIKRNGEFTVNIALIHQQKPVLGVVSIPVTGDTYYAGNGIGAFKQNQNTKAALKIRKPIDFSSEGIRVVASRSHLDVQTISFVESLKNPTLVSKGSSLKFLLLADGSADVYPRFAPTMEWDTAAAHAIVNQVGIKVFQKDSNEELVYNKENLLNPFFICKS